MDPRQTMLCAKETEVLPHDLLDEGDDVAEMMRLMPWTELIVFEGGVLARVRLPPPRHPHAAVNMSWNESAISNGN